MVRVRAHLVPVVSLLTARHLGVSVAERDDEGEEEAPQTVDEAQGERNNNHQDDHSRPPSLSVNLRRITITSS